MPEFYVALFFAIKFLRKFGNFCNLNKIVAKLGTTNFQKKLAQSESATIDNADVSMTNSLIVITARIDNAENLMTKSSIAIFLR